MTRSIREALIATFLFASVAAMANAVSAAAISATESTSGAKGAGADASLIDASTAWLDPDTSVDRRSVKVASLTSPAGLLGNVAPIVSSDWTRYNQLGETGAGALRVVGEEIRCLALNIYHEARGEPISGQRAVGHVVMNRVLNSRYPNSICAVVQQGGDRKLHACQFSWWCDGRSDQPTDRDAWRVSMRIAVEIYLGYSKDPTGGAMWYHADYVNPRWSSMFKRGPKIGQHIFYLAQAKHNNM